MHTRSVREEFMSGSEAEEIAEKLFKSLLQMYQDNLNEKMRGSDFIFNGVNYLFYDFNRISISKGGSYIESPKWLKDKKMYSKPKKNLKLIIKMLLLILYMCLLINLNKYNLVRDNQMILLMISNDENWHYLAVKSLSRLLRGITSKDSYRTENKLNAHKKICENNEYCNIEMPSTNNKLIKYNQGDKSLKLPFIIYADLECLLKKNRYMSK